jgi:outer membrane protein
VIADAAAPAFEIVWFATPRVALASIAAPSRHAFGVRGSALGDVPLGSAWVASPNLAVQFHPWPAARVSPYVGAGATLFLARSDGGTRAPFVGGVAASSAVGPLLNLGVDVEVAPNWLLNLDARRAFLRTEASVNAGLVRANLRLDPWVVGGALRYRF